MSAGESVVLRSAKPHVGKENAMLPPLTSPSRVLSLSKSQKFTNSKASAVRRPNMDEDAKGQKNSPPSSSEKHAPNQQRRIQQLEKSILFMKDHHEKILFALHEEIDQLKRKNKELNFRLVMWPDGLPAHLLSPEDDQPLVVTSPRHQPQPPPQLPPVQLELLEGELAELKRQLQLERLRSEQLAAQLSAAQADRGGLGGGSDPERTAGLESRLAEAESSVRQLRRERDQYQREVRRMRDSIQFRPPWRGGGGHGNGNGHGNGHGGGQTAAGPPLPARSSNGSSSQQQLPRIPSSGRGTPAHRVEPRGSTAPPRPAESRPPGHGSLPALPSGRARQQQKQEQQQQQTAPPPPPPRRTPKQ